MPSTHGNIGVEGKNFLFFKRFSVKHLTKQQKLAIIIGQTCEPRSVIFAEILKW